MPVQSAVEFYNEIQTKNDDTERAEYFQHCQADLPGFVQNIDSFCHVFMHLRTNERLALFNQLSLDWVEKIDKEKDVFRVLKCLNRELILVLLEQLTPEIVDAIDMSKCRDSLKGHKTSVVNFFKQEKNKQTSSDANGKSYSDPLAAFFNH